MKTRGIVIGIAGEDGTAVDDLVADLFNAIVDAANSNGMEHARMQASELTTVAFADAGDILADAITVASKRQS